MAYRIIVTRQFEQSLDECIDYLAELTRNKYTINNFLKKIEVAISTLESFPESSPVLENQKLEKKHLRKIHLIHFKYKIFYRVEKELVYLIDILHDSQDYENRLN